MLLVERDTNLIKHQGMNYDLQDHQTVVLYSTGVINFIFADLNKDNSYLVEHDNIPGFIGNKYKYEDEEVVLNPDWIEEE